MNFENNQQPFVSVVMPTYNQADFISQSIDSVFNQSYPDLELIVIDNYSDDRTEEIVAGYTKADPRIKYTKFSNKGIIAASRNLGIKMASGQLVSFIDSDDVWLPSKLDKQIGHFQDKEVIGVGAQTLWMNGPLVSRKYFARQGEYCDYRHSDFLLSNRAICSSVIVRKDIVADLNGFDESRDFLYIEDWELWLRVAQRGKFRILKEPLLLYRIQPNRSRQAVESSKRRFFVIDKHLNLGPIAKDDIKEAKANINLTIALSLIRLEDPQSRDYFVKALKDTSKLKTKLKAFGGYLLSILPVKLVKALRFLFQNFKALGYRKVRAKPGGKESVSKRYRELLLEIDKFINLREGKVLDFGCGSGAGTIGLSLQGINIIGVDNNQPGNDSIKEAREYALECKSKATFTCMDGEYLSFPEESFNAVLAIDVFEHLKNPQKVLSEIKRVLKAGGSLVMIWQPYYAPYGGHLKFYSKNPWRQLMPFFNKEKYLRKACKRNPISSYQREIKVINSLNKLTMRQFRKMIGSSGLNLKVIKRVPFKVDESITGLSIERFLRVILNKLPLIPIIEEFTTQSVLIILEKKD